MTHRYIEKEVKSETKFDVKQEKTLGFNNKTVSNIESTTTEKSRISNGYRIDSKGCKIIDWPLFDSETKPLFKNLSKVRIKCGSRKPKINIKRINGTWIQLDWSKLPQIPLCYVSQFRRGVTDNDLLFGNH